jgi:PHD/YefM family antitoxin component YafN of YafNO toxin-antitoxin module
METLYPIQFPANTKHISEAIENLKRENVKTKVILI